MWAAVAAARGNIKRPLKWHIHTQTVHSTLQLMRSSGAKKRGKKRKKKV
jgi:hypothetical protein